MATQARRPLASFLTSRVQALAPSPTIAVSDKARRLKSQGIDVIDLSVATLISSRRAVRGAAIEAMNAGDTHYVASAGIPACGKPSPKNCVWRLALKSTRLGSHRHSRRETGAV